MKHTIKTTVKWLTRIFLWQFFSVVLWFLAIRLAYFVVEKPSIFMSDFLYEYCFYTEKAPCTWFVLALYFLSVSLAGYSGWKKPTENRQGNRGAISLFPIKTRPLPAK